MLALFLVKYKEFKPGYFSETEIETKGEANLPHDIYQNLKPYIEPITLYEDDSTNYPFFVDGILSNHYDEIIEWGLSKIKSNGTDNAQFLHDIIAVVRKAKELSREKDIFLTIG